MKTYNLTLLLERIESQLSEFSFKALNIEETSFVKASFYNFKEVLCAINTNQPANANAVQATSYSLLELVNELLEYSKLAANEEQLQRIEFILFSLVKGLMFLCNMLISTKNKHGVNDFSSELLPILKANDIQSAEKYNPYVNYNVSLTELLEIELVFEEMFPELLDTTANNNSFYLCNIDKKLKKLLKNLNDDLIKLINTSEKKSEKSSGTIIEELKLQEKTHVFNEIEFTTILQKELQAEQNILDWVLAENEARLEMKQKLKTILDNQGILGYKIPKPIFYAEDDASTIALLNDIESLGDTQELSLLKEMLCNEKETPICEHVTAIEQFETQPNEQKDLEDNNTVFSVFEKFFSNIDDYSKLILLDEMIIVGDEKDIPFLHRFIAESTGELNDKAQQVLLKLKERLQKDFTSATDNLTFKNELKLPRKIKTEKTEKPFNVFNIEFDLTESSNIQNSRLLNKK